MRAQCREGDMTRVGPPSAATHAATARSRLNYEAFEPLDWKDAMLTDKITRCENVSIFAPCNVRDTRESAIGIIGNGCCVRVLQNGADDGGRPWSFVATLDGHPVGWVYRELISHN
jgi:hypothetical protein